MGSLPESYTNSVYLYLALLYVQSIARQIWFFEIFKVINSVNIESSIKYDNLCCFIMVNVAVEVFIDF